MDNVGNNNKPGNPATPMGKVGPSLVLKGVVDLANINKAVEVLAKWGNGSLRVKHIQVQIQIALLT